MKKYWPLALIVIGVMIILMGFVYDVFFAGIPYQDPTPELTAVYNLHSQIAAVIRCVGMRVCLAGGGVFAVLGIIRELTSLKDLDR
jgi:hypothetical protein